MNIVRIVFQGVLFVVFNVLVIAGLAAFSELLVFAVYRFPPNHSVLRSTARYYYRSFEADILTFLPSCAQYDESLSYILKPGKCSFANREYETTVRVNSLGLRDDEQSLQQPSIVALGDSFTMGWGVEQDQTFAELVEQSSGHTVLNAGIPSYGTAREFVLFSKVDTSALQAVFLQYNANDVNENMAYAGLGNRLHLMRRMDYEFAREQRRRQLRKEYYPGKYLREYLPLLLERFQEPEPALAEKADKVRAEVDVFLNVLAQSKVDLRDIPVFVFETSSYNSNNSTFIAELEKRPAPRLVHFENAEINLIPLDISTVISDDDYYLLDSHWRASGHRKMADLLLKELQKVL